VPTLIADHRTDGRGNRREDGNHLHKTGVLAVVRGVLDGVVVWSMSGCGPCT